VQYRRFGKTELSMPVISCGGMRYQTSWKREDAIDEDNQKGVETCIRRALDLGVTHIETAWGYGTSEEQLGRILPGLPRDEIIVQTKVGPSSDPKKFEALFEESMSKLKLDYIDLFGFHGINNEECIEKMMRCLESAKRYQREGRLRHIGFSTHGHCSDIIKAIQTDEMEYVNLHWYYIFQDNWPAILEARKRDMGVFIISPNDKGGQLYKPSEKLRELTAPLDPMVFNGLFCLSRPEVHTLSCGVARASDFDIHMETVAKVEQAEELAAPIAERLDAAMRVELGGEWVDTWQEGLPEWDATPGEINMPVILRMWNLAKAFDLVEYGKMRYNLLGSGGHWFPGNGLDDLDQYDLSECLANSPHAAIIPDRLREAYEIFKGEKRQRLQVE